MGRKAVFLEIHKAVELEPAFCNSLGEFYGISVFDKNGRTDQ